ncbi:hypothetical protein P152DRAFT_266990 [Eremomyces bilateralis CBS 781.70]|uniref:Uncharacterized protein n=1 Tax=Eremomyces bilateralis CBS 781.70 TaxID=1392243 RepID=A0A6G1G8X3_9PEZI|nr:uncharacterized protein P152DRAFT_266990 [Eremomyces bilateralis CBS 781.70]KAF1814309.1 hypothetical protein P152DRAFT_266990 [Eremomyces bilateralis CBS 781.70]
MSGEFFNSWPLWAKMTFVLGCAIVITFAMGCFKLWHSHRKLKKYVLADEKEATPAMVEAQVSLDTESEVPFGVRALEKGIEVDGVWISRTNTPNSSAPGSPRISFAKGSPVLLPNLDLPSVSSNDFTLLGSKPSSPSSSRAPSYVFERAVGAERLPSNPSSSTLAVNVPGDGGRQYSSRYEPVPTSTASMRDAESSPESGSPTEDDTRDRTSGGSSLGSVEGSTSQEDDATTGKGKVKAQRRPRNERANLDLLHSHRLSHVAETGQLTPRVKRPALGSDLTGVSADGARFQTAEYTMNRRSAPLPPMLQLANRNSLPDHAESPKADRNALSTIPDDTIIPGSGAFQPHRNTLAFLPHAPSESGHPRKVNSGFEVLAPGSKPRMSINVDDARLEDDNYEPKEKRQSKRLQKKRQSPPADGIARVSKFVEGGLI